ncbi:MAG: hypothetical protein PUB89_13370 [Oscillospiraceae bacterium]|nr:hypothetical protein [Oscillospiraceae bacterium]
MKLESFLKRCTNMYVMIKVKEEKETVAYCSGNVVQVYNSLQKRNDEILKYLVSEFWLNGTLLVCKVVDPKNAWCEYRKDE